MYTYIALLRGINVSGQKKIKMAELRDAMSAWGLAEVRTYIQSGNLVFKYKEQCSEELQGIIRDGIKESFGYEVGVWISERDRFIEIIERNPFIDGIDLNHKEHYYIFHISPPDQKSITHLHALDFEGEKFVIEDECTFLFCSIGYGKSKCGNNFFEKKLRMQATARNYRTVQKLIELSA